MPNGFGSPILIGEQNFATGSTYLFPQDNYSGEPFCYFGVGLNQLISTHSVDGLIVRGNWGGGGVVGWGGGEQGTGVIGGGGVQSRLPGSPFTQRGGTGVAGFGGDSSPIFETQGNVLAGDGVQGLGGAGAAGYTVPAVEPLGQPLVVTAFRGGTGVYAVGGGGSPATNIPANAVDGQDANAGIGVWAFGGDPNGLALGGRGWWVVRWTP
jgi:hypothetical protein